MNRGWRNAQESWRDPERWFSVIVASRVESDTGVKVFRAHEIHDLEKMSQLLSASLASCRWLTMLYTISARRYGPNAMTAARKPVYPQRWVGNTQNKKTSRVGRPVYSMQVDSSQ